MLARKHVRSQATTKTKTIRSEWHDESIECHIASGSIRRRPFAPVNVILCLVSGEPREMGFVEDYCGGWDSIPLFTNEDGETDWQAAYDAQLPCSDSEDDQETDPFMRACNYKFKMVMIEMGIDLPKPKRNRGQKVSVLPGWVNTGLMTCTSEGSLRPIFRGNCSSCQAPCTLPFPPMQHEDPSKCKKCLCSGTNTQHQASSPKSSSNSMMAGFAGASSQKQPKQDSLYQSSSSSRKKKGVSATSSLKDDVKQPKQDTMPKPLRSLNPTPSPSYLDNNRSGASGTAGTLGTQSVLCKPHAKAPQTAGTWWLYKVPTLPCNL